MDANSKNESTGFTYSAAGVDIAHTDSLKAQISSYLKTEDRRVLNGLGPFASLYDFKFDDIPHPLLVLKTEEPGSKQKLAVKYGYAESVCHDMINHLVNDIIVMGATPLAVLDTIVCGSAEPDIINKIVKGISDACRINECSLVGGETSVQPGIVDNGTYILTSSIAGVVDKSSVIDGSKISEGDIVLAVASNGLHTNGYTLVRMLLDKIPDIADETVNNETFIEAIMKPHTAYYHAVKGFFGSGRLHGMAHITGGGIEGNVKRIIPQGLCADIDLSSIQILPLFSLIRNKGNIDDDEMLSTFNCGAGLILVVSPADASDIIKTVSNKHNCYPIGTICRGSSPVLFRNSLKWT